MEFSPQLRRWWLKLILVALVAIAAISTTAVVDHNHKTAMVRPFYGAGWFCAHQGRRCVEAGRADSIQARWHTREKIYKSSVAVLAGAIAALGALRLMLFARTRNADRRRREPT
jgi:hypothetical protein